MSARTTSQETETTPRCKRCGYDLTGIAPGTPCPECGLGSSPRVQHRRSGDNLTDAEPWYLRLLAVASTIAAIGLVATVILSQSFDAAPTLKNAAIFSGCVAMWTIGIVLCAWPRPKGPSTVRDVVLDAGWMRLIVIGAQSLHLLSAGLAVAIASTSGQADTLFVAYEIVNVLAFIGVVPVAIYISSIADWAGDDGLSSRMRIVAWGVAVPTIVIPAINVLGAIWIGFQVLHLLSFVLLFAAFVSFVLLIVGMIQLAVMSWWAIGNARAAAARDQRLAEKREREQREAMARLDAEPIPAAPPPSVKFAEQPDFTNAPPPSNRPKSSGYRIERSSDDGETYELADE